MSTFVWTIVMFFRSGSTKTLRFPWSSKWQGMLYNARGTTAFPVRPAASAAIRWGNPAIIQYFLPVILHFSYIPAKIHLFTHFLSIQVKMTRNSCIFAGFPVSPADPGKKLQACRNFVLLGLLHRFSNSYVPLVPPFFSFLFRVPASTPSPPLLFHSVSHAPHSMTPASLSRNHPPLPILQKN